MTHSMTALAAIATFCAALAVAGNGDFQDQQLQHDGYCQMVRDGHWPAFNGRAGCPGG